MNDLKILRVVLGFALILLFLPEESLLRRLHNAPAHYYGELWFAVNSHQYLLARNSSAQPVLLELPANSVQVSRTDGGVRPLVATEPTEMKARSTAIIEAGGALSRQAWDVSQEGVGRFVPSGLEVVTRAEVDRVIGLVGCLVLLAAVLALALARYAMERNVVLQDESG